MKEIAVRSGTDEHLVFTARRSNVHGKSGIISDIMQDIDVVTTDS